MAAMRRAAACNWSGCDCVQGIVYNTLSCCLGGMYNLLYSIFYFVIYWHPYVWVRPKMKLATDTGPAIIGALCCITTPMMSSVFLALSGLLYSMYCGASPVLRYTRPHQALPCTPCASCLACRSSGNSHIARQRSDLRLGLKVCLAICSRSPLPVNGAFPLDLRGHLDTIAPALRPLPWACCQPWHLQLLPSPYQWRVST